MEVKHIIVIIFFSAIFFLMRHTKKIDKERKEKKVLENQKKNEIEKKNHEDFRNKSIAYDLEQIKNTQEKWNKVHKMDIYKVGVFKNNIINNENLILDKGGYKQLFSLLKIDSFLNDFRNKILNDKDEVDLSDDFFEMLRNDLQNHRDGYFRDNFKLIITYSDIDVIFESRIKTLEYYENIANTMLVFYLNDNKVLYFEIYQAFEKLGVFDSSWQKLVLKKMEDIHEVLKEMNDKLSEINNNFQNLVDSTETITKELNSINSTIKTGNMIQVISAYQQWRMNNKINN